MHVSIIRFYLSKVRDTFLPKYLNCRHYFNYVTPRQINHLKIGPYTTMSKFVNWILFPFLYKMGLYTTYI